MKKYILVPLCLACTLVSAQNSFPLLSSGANSGGTGDFTNVTTPQLKLEATSSYIRVPHLSANPTVSTVYNFETGKDVYWGEPSDVGSYFFRGRKLVVQSGNVGIGTITPSSLLHLANTATNVVDLKFSTTYNGGAIRYTGTSVDNSNQRLAFTMGAGSELLTIFNDGKISTNGALPVGTLNVGAPANSNAMTLGSSAGVAFSTTISGLYGLYMGVSGTGNTWIQGGRSDGSTTPYDINFQASGGNIGIGTVSPTAKLDVYSNATLGSTAGNFVLLNRFYSGAGSGGNNFMDNSWLYRDADGNNWLTARLHKGISIDGSFTSPGVNTRTWWERDPFNNIQSWGDTNATYLTINQGWVGVGTTAPEARLHIYDGGIRHGGTGEINIDAIGIIGGRFKIMDNGNVGIGTSNPDAKLAVKGTIHTQEVKVDLTGAVAPDYVFEETYELQPLTEVEKYIKQNKHLPEVPSAKEMEAEGLNLKEMNLILLKKIEELTLHLIDKEKQLQTLEERIEILEKKK